MSGSTFSRLKVWVEEILSDEDLNNEIDNIMENLDAVGVGGYSNSVAQMKLETTPGALGSESLAASLAGEIERIRYVIARILNADLSTYWYEASAFSLATLGQSIGGGIPANRIISGAVGTLSNVPAFLVPAGSARTITLDATPTPFNYAINATEYSISADQTITNLTLAPSTNNTCLVNDAGLTATEDTKYVGQFGSELTVDAMGASVSALVGRLAAFKLTHSGSSEYFIARIDSTTKLTGIQRGYFYNSAGAAIPRLAVSDNDTITLMKLTWIFVTTTGGILPVYTEPRVSATEPASPSTGDYWFDLANDTWKTYNATTWIAANATLIGVCLQDSANTIAARGFDVYRAIADDNTLALELFDATEVRANTRSTSTSVFGQSIRFEQDYARWDIDTDLDTGAEAASTLYFLYLTEDGAAKISLTGPHYRAELLGLYHPNQMWRCYGSVYNDASSNFEAVISYHDTSVTNIALTQAVAANALTVIVHAHPMTRFPYRNTSETSGAMEFSSVLPGTRLAISSGSTLGMGNTVTAGIYASLVFYAHRGELSLSLSSNSRIDLVTTVAEGGAGAADSAATIYSIAARTSVPNRAIGKLVSTQTTAGTWAALASKILPVPLLMARPFTIQVFTASGTYTKPTGLSQALVISTGGGGGGGGADVVTSGSAAAGGGAAAGTCIEIFLAGEIGATETVTIGAAGAGGSIAGGNGTAGGNTTFGSLHTATGGSLGSGAIGSSSSVSGAGGAAVAAVNGLINISGAAGMSGNTPSTTYVLSGAGGASIWGDGGQARMIGASSVVAGGTAVTYGSGGSGAVAHTVATGAVGGDGMTGICIVIEFYDEI